MEPLSSEARLRHAHRRFKEAHVPHAVLAAVAADSLVMQLDHFLEFKEVGGELFVLRRHLLRKLCHQVRMLGQHLVDALADSLPPLVRPLRMDAFHWTAIAPAGGALGRELAWGRHEPVDSIHVAGRARRVLRSIVEVRSRALEPPNTAK
jgi:hypothetical protein